MTDPRLQAFWHYDCLRHEPPEGEFEMEWSGLLAAKEPHPDRRERVENVRTALDTELGDTVEWNEAPLATRAQLERVHEADYLDHLREVCERVVEDGAPRFTATTSVNEHTYRAARRAAGGAIGATETALTTGEGTVGYSCTRPSGHHAAMGTADGFCYVNNAAVAAEHALAAGRGEVDGVDADVDRVAILDWDIHHGNGTQECFYGREDVLFVSLHNDHGAWDPDSHPQTGGVEEHGEGAGEGYTVNAPLPAGVGDEGYARLFDDLVEPVVREYDPDLVVASAGGDAGIMDPLGRNMVTKAGFEDVGGRVRTLADDVADGSLAVVQEGGYQPSHLGYAMLGTIEGMLGVDGDVSDPFDWLDEDLDLLAPRLDEVVAGHADYWPV